MNIEKITHRPHQFIKQFAAHLHTESHTDCLEEILDLPSSYGTGKLRGFQFSEGIGLILFDCTFLEDVSIYFDELKIPALQFNFNVLVQGGIKHFLNNQNIQYFLNPLQGTITASPLTTHQGLQFPANQPIVFACLMIDRAQYIDKIDCILDTMPDKLRAVFSDTKAEYPFFYQGNYSITSSECIQTILNDTHQGLVRSTYIEGVALELFSCQIKQFNDDLKAPSKQITLRKQDVEKILEAKEILVTNMQTPPTIEVLAKKVGINQSKLKSGFKKVFDKPVKTWLRDKRLEMSKLLLLKNDKSIREVAETVGYTSQGHFSKRFKQKYGVLPKDYMQSVKTKLDEFQGFNES